MASKKRKSNPSLFDLEDTSALLFNGRLDGDADEDVFTFGPGSGQNVISDFQGAGLAGGDVILLNHIPDRDSFAAVEAATVYYIGQSASAQIDLGDGDIVMVNDLSRNFASGDFAFI